MPSERVLICGAGVAGSIAAYWLAKHDFEVVVIERSKAEQKAGQGIEIEQPALQVVQAMGILDKLNEIRTGELGFDLVDQQSRSHASFKLGGFGPTGALELMRGDFTEVLHKTADEFSNVTYRFETTIQSLRQTPNKVIVDLQDRNTKITTTEEFDFVIGADGARSRTRQLVMGPPEELKCFKAVGAFVAYFSIPREEQDWPYSQLCHFTNRRVVWLRPTREESNTTSVYLIHVKNRVPALRQANDTGDRQQQKEAFAQVYSGLGWETPRVVKQMLKSDNFYSDELVQVKLQRWSQHRVVLVGDAAWAPTPFTGQGNQLAIIGSWVLAQELSRNRTTKAFELYDQRLRAYVEICQNIPLGGYAPRIFVPQTIFGIWLLRKFLYILSLVSRLAAWANLTKLLPDRDRDDFDLEMEGKTANRVQ